MSDTPQRRATDKEGAAPAPAQGPTLADVYALLTEIKTTQEGMISAFVLDDLGKPDFSGHRAAHKKQIADADAMKQYKAGLTRSVVDWVTKGALALSLMALLNAAVAYMKDHLK